MLTRHANANFVMVTQTGKAGRIFYNSEPVLGGYDVLSSVYVSALTDVLGDNLIAAVSVVDQGSELLRDVIEIVRGWANHDGNKLERIER